MKLKNISWRHLLVSVFLFLALAVAVHAADPIVPSEGKESGNYTLNDMVQVGVNIAEWILGIVGSLTFLMFIYGGFMLLISAGNAESVTKGKKIIIGAIVGLIIVFASYLIIQFFLTAIGGSFNGTVPGTS